VHGRLSGSALVVGICAATPCDRCVAGQGGPSFYGMARASSQSIDYLYSILMAWQTEVTVIKLQQVLMRLNSLSVGWPLDCYTTSIVYRLDVARSESHFRGRGLGGQRVWMVWVGCALALSPLLPLDCADGAPVGVKTQSEPLPLNEARGSTARWAANRVGT